jgi:hypothetical protein
LGSVSRFDKIADDDPRIASFWTDKADIAAEVGEMLTLGFPDAPVPFDLLLPSPTTK